MAVKVKNNRLYLLDVMGVDPIQQALLESKIIYRIKSCKFSCLGEFFKVKDDEIFKQQKKIQLLR